MRAFFTFTPQLVFTFAYVIKAVTGAKVVI